MIKEMSTQEKRQKDFIFVCSLFLLILPIVSQVFVAKKSFNDLVIPIVPLFFVILCVVFQKNVINDKIVLVGTLVYGVVVLYSLIQGFGYLIQSLHPTNFISVLLIIIRLIICLEIVMVIKNKTALKIWNRIIVILFIVTILFCVSPLFPQKEKSEWDKLTDQEKEWYEKSYGDGKSEAIDKAISDYEDSY